MRFPITKIKTLSIAGAIGALLIMPLFNIYAQPSEAAKSALKEIVDLQENKVESAESRQDALLKVLKLTSLETQDFLGQLKNIKNLNIDHILLRDQLQTQLNDYLLYLESLTGKLINERPELNEIINLANEFKSWREKKYNPIIKNVLNFILVFQEKATLKTAQNRFDKINNDINKLKPSKYIKPEQLLVILNEAADKLRSAQALNDEAQELLLEKESQEKIKKTVESAFNEIKATYKSFFKMSVLVKDWLSAKRKQ